MKDLWDLISAFFRVGLFTFGGGYAMLPMLQREVVEKHGWITEEEVLDCYAIGQCTPGVIAVNTATFVGYKRKGIPGAVAATVGIVLPPLIIITIIARVLQDFAEYEMVVHAFAGIRVAVAVLVIMAVVKLYKTGVKGAAGNAIFVGACILTVAFGVSPVWIVLAAIVGGIALTLARKKGGAGQ